MAMPLADLGSARYSGVLAIWMADIEYRPLMEECLDGLKRPGNRDHNEESNPKPDHREAKAG